MVIVKVKLAFLRQALELFLNLNSLSPRLILLRPNNNLFNFLPFSLYCSNFNCHRRQNWVCSLNKLFYTNNFSRHFSQFSSVNWTKFIIWTAICRFKPICISMNRRKSKNQINIYKFGHLKFNDLSFLKCSLFFFSNRRSSKKIEMEYRFKCPQSSRPNCSPI